MSNVNKPVIPAEVADAIEELRGKGENNRGILMRRERVGNPYYLALMSIHYDTLMAALANGYERELTEEQARKQTYAEIVLTLQRHREGTGRYDKYDEDHAFADGVQYTLDMLGIDALEQS
ncbi:DUF1642 domain-containing protein [Paenibacillus terrae]|uniref:DUF1642 domain-containing protein n=1 Tax=Paenibacillus terrae TaxID=159743 RepID=UPI0011EB6C0E|nr:DUF1642 domain-containing protein [Paenibacillus terrae]